MPKEPEERYLEWLDRIEQTVGIGTTQRLTINFGDVRKLLRDELDIEPTVDRMNAVFDWAKTRYQELPEVGILSFGFQRDWGVQQVYRDATTGRFTSYQEVKSRLNIFFGR